MNRLIADNVNAMDGYTPGEQPKYPDTVKLNTNENPFPPSPLVGNALASFDFTTLNRYPDPMAVKVRELIAQIHDCSPSNVFAGNGSDEVLSLAIKCFAHDNGSVGCFDPTYSLYPVLAQIRNVSILETSLNEDFTFRMPPKDFQPDLFFLTNPNAPTGVAYAKEEITAFCKTLKGVVLIDEAYADFAKHNCMDLATDIGNTNIIVSRTLSKSFSLAGLRFGYAVGPVELIEAMYKIKDSYNLDGITQALAHAALSDLAHMKNNAAKIKAEREELSLELARKGWTVIPSQTNFIFARPPKGNAKEIFAALKEKHIFVRYFPQPKTAEYLRITIGTHEENQKFLSSI